jgi:hypothetical protein
MVRPIGNLGHLSTERLDNCPMAESSTCLMCSEGFYCMMLVASKPSRCQLDGVGAVVGGCGEQCHFFLPLVGRGSQDRLPLQSFVF